MNAIVLGATGAVGGALVRALLASPQVTEVRILVRRVTGAFDRTPGADKLRTQVIDLTNTEDATGRLAPGCDAAFCTMGVGQPRKVGREEFWRVDVEYPGAFARGARAAGVRHFSLLSSVGASDTTRNRYLAVKGAAEAAVTRPGFPRVSLFRPSLLTTPEVRYGLQDRVLRVVFPPLGAILPARLHHVHVEDLGRAMALNALRPGRPGVEVLYYPDFVRLLAEEHAP